MAGGQRRIAGGLNRSKFLIFLQNNPLVILIELSPFARVFVDVTS